VVVLNKADLVASADQAVGEASAVAGGLPVHAVSAKSASGVSAVETYLAPGQTLALLGPSGVGKSSIVNRLVGAEVLPTGEVRDWDRRGRHTSVHRQLVMRAAGGLIVDTPGMRELQLWDSSDEIGGVFGEIAELAGQCRFRDCQHDAEPGCAVKAAVADGRVDAERYESYLKLSHEQAAMERMRDERALRDQKRQAKIQGKALKSMQKSRGR
jgi:ribosome biogenesis GTPase